MKNKSLYIYKIILFFVCTVCASVYSYSVYAKDIQTNELDSEYMQSCTTSDEDIQPQKAAGEAYTNLVLFVDFSDTITHEHGTYDSYCFKKSGNADMTFTLFDGTDSNGTVTDPRGMKTYLDRVSYGAFAVNNIFPQYDPDTNTITPYVLTNTAAYYKENYTQMLSELMQSLDLDAVGKSRIASETLSHSGDYVIDNVMIVVGCATDSANDPFGGVTFGAGGYTFTHADGHTYQVGSYNIVTESGAYLGYSGSGLLIHEFMHSIGYPDLYVNQTVNGVKPIPVGAWDIMSSENQRVQYPLAYMRQYISGWLELPTITRSQTYSLTAATSTTAETKNKQAVILKTPYSDSEFFVVEYRQKQSAYQGGAYSYAYDAAIAGSGIIVYRINTNVRNNISGAPYLVYVYRPGDTVDSSGYESADADSVYISNSFLSSESGRTSYGSSDMQAGLADGAITYSDGTNSGIVISNVGSAAGDEITFDITFPEVSSENYWNTLTSGRDGEETSMFSSCMDSDGSFYYVQTALSSAGGATKLFKLSTDGQWTELGSAPVNYAVNNPVLVIYNDRLYMAYGTADGYLELACYNNSVWTVVFKSAQPITEFSAVAGLDGIHMIYNGASYQGVYAATYNGSGSNTTTVAADTGTWLVNVDIAIADGTTYAAYRNFSDGNLLTVKKCVSGVWSEVAFGQAATDFRLYGDDNKLYIAANTEGKLVLYSIDVGVETSSWIEVGGKEIVTASVGDMDMVTVNGVPYIAYSTANKVCVYNLSGGSWTQTGNIVASAYAGNIELLSSGGYLYITYRDNNSYKTVLKSYRLVDTPTEPDIPTEPDTPTEPDIPVQPVIIPDVEVQYRTHIQNIGWQSNMKNGQMSGTSGRSYRLEGIEISVTGNSNLGIQYTTHCQDYGWLPWSADGDMSGTEGESKRLEAIEICLTGVDSSNYDVYYRVHAQNMGWLGWAGNGAPAGTAGYSYRLEAIQIVVVKKGASAPGIIFENVNGLNTKYPYAYYAKPGLSPVVNAPATDNQNPQVTGVATPNVVYRTHIQNVGWQAWRYNGQLSGTTGRSYRLEGINIKLTNKPYSGGVRYMTHIQNIGWEQDFRYDGQMSGTSGRSYRLEAIRIELYGEMAKHYDIYYRVHAQNFGWLSWAKNGEAAGTAGYSYRLEGIQIVLTPKGSPAPAGNYGGVVSNYGLAYIGK